MIKMIPLRDALKQSAGLTVLILTAVAMLTIAGCGERKESTTAKAKPELIELALDWYPNPDHVGIYTAIAEGRFKDVGIEVKPRIPSDPAAPIKQVASEQVDLAISYQPEVLIARDKGLPVVAVAALVQRPLTSLISLKKEKIKSAKDLKGKRVGTAGIPYQSAYLKTILKKAKVTETDVKETSVGANLLPALLTGKVDAILGGFWNVEAIELKLQRKAANTVPVDQLGVPPYQELVLVANENVVRDEPQWLHRFLAAIARGSEDAKRDPRAASKVMIKANSDLDPKLVRSSVAATLPALFPDKKDLPIGYMSPIDWERYSSWMVDNDLIRKRPEIAKALTNRFLLR